MKGTTGGKAKHLMAVSKSGIRHGPSVKNLRSTRRNRPTPTGPTSPIKGSDRGGV